MIAQDCGTDFENLSEAEIDLAISNLTLEDRQALSRSRFCYLWAVVTHPATKLVSQGIIKFLTQIKPLTLLLCRLNYSSI